MNPFVPINQQARSKYVRDWAATAEVGDFISYEQLAELMGATERSQVQHAVRKALLRIEEDHSKTLETIVGEGYRVGDVRAHLRGGFAYRRRASKALQRGRSKVDSVDLSQVTDPVTRQHVETLRTVFDTQQEVERRLAARVKREQRLFKLT